MRSLLHRIFLALALMASTGLSFAATQVIVQTNKGDITLELNEEKAPLTVANFMRYVDEGFYNGTIFHRVIKDFMVQGGGLSQDMDKKDTHDPVRNEAANGLKNKIGTVAMARTSDPHSATAQFFINHKDNDFLDYPGSDGWGYCVFGKVTKGMDVVDSIANVPTTVSKGRRDVPKEPVIIESIKRVEN